MMIILILIGVAFLGGWITLIHLVVRNEVRFEDKQKDIGTNGGTK